MASLSELGGVSRALGLVPMSSHVGVTPATHFSVA